MLPEAQLALIDVALDRLAGLDALWLFGSEATGRATSRSDVDLAALFARRPSPLALVAAREGLQEILGRAVDLVDLERASPVLAMQALRHGRLVVDRNPTHRVRFTAALPGRYEDVAILRRPAERLLLARLAHGRT
jgi:hypothetical protein